MVYNYDLEHKTLNKLPCGQFVVLHIFRRRYIIIPLRHVISSHLPDAYSSKLSERKVLIHTCCLSAFRRLVSSFCFFSCITAFFRRRRKRQGCFVLDLTFNILFPATICLLNLLIYPHKHVKSA